VAQQREVLLIEEGSAPSAALLRRRLRRLGFRTTQAHHTDELNRSLDRPGLPFRAVLLSTGMPSARLATFAASLRQRLAVGGLTGLAVGRAPAPEIRQRLREAGFTLALWLPFDDHTLRFQVNRAFLRARCKGPARGELRAPLAWRVTVHAAGRRKEAQLYNLSERGAFLETARPSTVGAEIDVADRHGHPLQGSEPGHQQRSRPNRRAAQPQPAPLAGTLLNVPASFRKRFAPG